MTRTRLRCQRCGRAFRRTLRDAGEWNGTFSGGRLIALLCPDCQTPEENAEAAINEATMDYRRGPNGEPLAFPKWTDDDE